MVAYRITARSLERQVVGEAVIREFKCLEDCAGPGADEWAVEKSPGKVVFVLEEDDGARPRAPARG